MARPFIILGAALLTGVIVLLGMPLAAEAALATMAGPEGPSPALAEGVYLLAIFLALGSAGWAGGRLSATQPLALGERPAREAVAGLAIGLGGVAVATFHGQLAGIVGVGPEGLAAIGLFLLGTLLVLIQVGAEEIFFRGWLQPALVRDWGAPAGIGVTALAFAALHLMGGPMHPVSFLNLFLGGLLFGLLALRSGGLAAALGAHFAWNWSEAMLLGLSPNPGAPAFGTLIDLELSGTLLWGGSEEGLNASLGMTAVLIALLALLIPSARRAPHRPYPAAA